MPVGVPRPVLPGMPVSLPPPSPADPAALRGLADFYRTLTEEIGKVIVGQHDVVELLAMALLSRGHCLLEGVPGLAKTLLISTLAQALDLSFKRIQFTPDLMPADITGTDILQDDPDTGRRRFVFLKGPLFAHIILADEINRTPPKTQAALLEAMQEHHVTAGGHTYALPEPFFVLATQNPIEQEGTYPLPEAQLDRFMFHIRVRYPSRDEELAVMKRTTASRPPLVHPVVHGDRILEAQDLVRQVVVADHVYDFAADLVRATRPAENGVPAFVPELIAWGAGPRASQYLILAAKARAVLHGRLHATTADVRAVAAPVLRHRLVLTFQAEAQGSAADDLVARLLESVRPAREDA